MKHLILFIALLVSNGLAIARTTMSDQLSKTTRMNTQSEIYFAGGCFWGTEHFMKQIDGVTNTRVGYANGKMSIKNPTYEQVCNDNTGFAETVEVSYDPRQADLKLLIELFFKTIAPTRIKATISDHSIVPASIIRIRTICRSSKRPWRHWPRIIPSPSS